MPKLREPKPTKCQRPKCTTGKPVTGRGLCSPCYQKARRQAKKDGTWEAYKRDIPVPKAKPKATKKKATKKSDKKLTGVERANQYRADVLTGEIDVCKHVQFAVLRQSKDLKRQNTEDFPFRFDEDAANHVVDFLEKIPHIEGKKAKETLVMEPWQCFVVTSFFGWLDEDGLRRYETLYLEIPKKNGKSFLLAGIGLYMLAADGEAGAKVYAAATTVKQAKMVFNTAHAIADSSPDLCEEYGITVHGNQRHHAFIEVPSNYSQFTPLARDQKGDKDGLNIHCAIVDEMHAHVKRDTWSIIEKGILGRENSVVAAITTAGYNMNGIGFEVHKQAVGVLDGSVDDDSFFACIYTLDDEDLEEDEWYLNKKNWYKANPNLGVSINERKFGNAIKRSSTSNVALQEIQTKAFNIWHSTADSWLDMVTLRKCKREFSWDDLKYETVWVGLDLSSRRDLVALVYLWIDDGIYKMKARYYLPKKTIKDSPNENYKKWSLAEQLVATEGASTDFNKIFTQVMDDADEMHLEGIGVDNYQSLHIVQDFEDEGLEATEVTQNFATMSPVMHEIEGLVHDGKFQYDDSPITDWCFENTVIKRSSKGSDLIMPGKEENENKIDGVSALFMAYVICNAEEKDDGGGFAIVSY